MLQGHAPVGFAPGRPTVKEAGGARRGRRGHLAEGLASLKQLVADHRETAAQRTTRCDQSLQSGLL